MMVFFALVGITLTSLSGLMAQEPPGTRTGPAVVDQVRSCLDQGQGRRAVQMIEAELGNNPSSRSSLVGLLKKSYEQAITEATRDGQTAEVAEYRECLAILNRRPQLSAPSVPVREPQSESSSGKARSNPTPPAAIAPASPAPQPEIKKAPPQGAPLPKPEVPAVQEPGSDSTSSGTDALAAIPEPFGTGKKGGNSAIRDVSIEKVAQPDTDRKTEPAPGSSNKNIKEPAADQNQTTDADPLAAADAAFREKRYEDAGKLYASLNKEGQLPESRKPIWAYCRRYDVVKRINSTPRTREEWQSIREEIVRIQQTTQKPHWYDEYLLEFVRENSRGSAVANDRAVPTVRGASPDEPRGLMPRKTPRTGSGSGKAGPPAGQKEPLFLPQETVFQIFPETATVISLRDRDVVRR